MNKKTRFLPKKKKKTRSQLVQAGFTSTDRLSSLPDAILDHILSFVNTKTVVQTSILSRRWKCVWKHVPALNLDHSSFERFSSFATFVDKVLALRDPLNVNRVSYYGCYPDEEDDDDEEEEEEDDDHFFSGYRFTSSALADTGSMVVEDPLVERVVEYAVFHGASHLDLGVDYSCSRKTNGYRFSESYTSIFGSDLETLSINSFEIDSLFGSFDFRALTEMELVYCDFQYGQDELLDPFSRFPCLKNLVLRSNHRDCSGRDNKFRISGPQLLNLKLLNLHIERIEISAPKLKSLTLHPLMIDPEFLKLDLPSLDDADIKFDSTCYSDCDEEVRCSFFEGCHNVKSLALCTEAAQELVCYIDELGASPFTRLENLTVSRYPMKMPWNIPDKVRSYLFEGSSCSAPSIKFIDRRRGRW
ncbi:F-box/LRR-repeat protein 13 [Linum perenne]